MPRGSAKIASSDESSKNKRTRQELESAGEEETQASSSRSSSKRQNRSKAPPRINANEEITGIAHHLPDSTKSSSLIDIPAGKAILPVAGMNDEELEKNFAEDTKVSLPSTVADLPPSTVPMAKISGGVSSGSINNPKIGKTAGQAPEDDDTKTSSGRTDENLSPGRVEGAENIPPVAEKVHKGNLETLVFLFALLLTFSTGAFLSFGMSAQLALGELRSNLQNCRALESHSKAEDEYYIQELETQVRTWKQSFRSKDAELKVLREECDVADEDE